MIRPTRKQSKEEDNPERKKKICEDGRKTRSSKTAKLVAGGATSGWLVDGDAKSMQQGEHGRVDESDDTWRCAKWCQGMCRFQVW